MDRIEVDLGGVLIQPGCRRVLRFLSRNNRLNIILGKLRAVR